MSAASSRAQAASSGGRPNLSQSGRSGKSRTRISALPSAATIAGALSCLTRRNNEVPPTAASPCADRRQSRRSPAHASRSVVSFPPGVVPERGDANLDGGPGNRPRPQSVFHLSYDVRFRDQETEPYAGQTIGLAEGTQHEQPGLRYRRHDAEPGLGKLGEGLVDDQPAS